MNENKRKSNRMAVVVTPEMREQLKQDAKTLGLRDVSVSQYVRNRLFSGLDEGVTVVSATGSSEYAAHRTPKGALQGDTPNSSVRVTFKANEQERAFLAHQAMEEGVSIEHFVRSSLGLVPESAGM